MRETGMAKGGEGDRDGGGEGAEMGEGKGGGLRWGRETEMGEGGEGRGAFPSQIPKAVGGFPQTLRHTQWTATPLKTSVLGMPLFLDNEKWLLGHSPETAGISQSLFTTFSP